MSLEWTPQRLRRAIDLNLELAQDLRPAAARRHHKNMARRYAARLHGQVGDRRG